MILQALASYYNRLLDDQSVDVAAPGFSTEKIHYEILLGPDGSLRSIDNIQQTPEKGSKLLPRMVTVPEPDKTRRGLKIAANFLWDNTGYLLGADAKGKPERAREQFAAFRKLAHALGDGLEDVGVRAVLAFLDAWNPDDAASLAGWEDMAGLNAVFRLDGELGYVHNRPAVREAWLRHLDANAGGAEGFCLVTGKPAAPARLHPSVKGVRGAQSSGAALVSFNLDAFTSYGKEQNYNAPVGERAAFAYVTALNHMLARDSDQKKQLGGTAEAIRQAAYGDVPAPRRRVLMVGDATTVFWTEKPTQAEYDFGAFFDNPDSGEDAHDGEIMQRLRTLVSAVAAGKEPPLWDGDESGTPFYILGLSPNAARLSVRFWHPSTVREMMLRIGQHFADLRIETAHPKNPEFPNPWLLLIEAVPQRKTENIPPTLGGELMRAVITGSSYPKSLYTRIIARIRADQEVNYLRAALLKACLNRAKRKGTLSETTMQTEVTVSLDPNNTNIGYLLGRLFAVLEKAQQDAIKGINTTIKDRFYGAASSTPRIVFPRLLNMVQHHISKSDYGYVSNILIAKVTERMTAEQGFPAHLSLSDQGMFALGYYHQRNDNFRPNNQKIESVKERK
jgi:CRISPR-associated protein Csd1